MRLALNSFGNRRRNEYQGEIQNKKEKRFAGLSSCSIYSPRADSYDVFRTHRMLLHHTPRLKRFHGLLSMSSCTVCPCFCITAFLSQLASSTGWFFHFTRYSKYCFCLVFLLTLLSSICSICGFSAIGICFCYWISSYSSPVFQDKSVSADTNRSP